MEITMTPKKQQIPHGPYCYKIIKVENKDGMPVVKTQNCPFRSYKRYGNVTVDFCKYLNKGDCGGVSDGEYRKLLKHFGSEEELDKVLSHLLLWDGVKECGGNDE
jgi:hypothetical protein